MSVIRVALIWESLPWRGGINYYRNLCSAVAQLPDSRIKIILFTGKSVDTHELETLVEVVRLPILERKSVPWFFWKLGVKAGRDVLLYQHMRNYHIDIISHFPSLWKGCPIPSIPWVADFQFLRLPDMFGEKETKSMVKYYEHVCKREKYLFVSSNDAKKDLYHFVGNGVCPVTYVLQFVSSPVAQDDVLSKQDLIDKYYLPANWFHLPNQFWKHKNHQVVIEALSKIKAQGKDVYVVATGNTTDFRNPDHYQNLMKIVEQTGIGNNFISLGEIPYADVVALMAYSIAVINPSFFEGWSTTVEEAKALGKKIILSDIPIHREQNPFRKVFFAPKDSNQLAEILLNELKGYSLDIEKSLQVDAKRKNANAVVEFAQYYERILLNIVLSKLHR